MKKIALIFVCLLSLQYVMAQQGKDGVGSFTATATVNLYTPLLANAAAGATSITVASTAGFSAGDLIYIIQMQGAIVRDSVGEYVNTTNSLGNDTSFGKIKAYNGAGNNEFAEITSVSGNIITIDCALKNSYSDTTYLHPGNTQIVRVPRYTSLTLSVAGLITCPAWDGHTGGVVVIEIQGNTIIGAGTSINVAGKGFRGGAVLNATASSATNTGASFGSTSSNNGAHKGESIAGDTNVYRKLDYNNIYFNSWSESTPLSTCKGNVANGGGGGNGNNCGGGGGSNGGVLSTWNGMGNADVSTPNNIAAWNQESTTPLNGSFRPVPFTSSGGGRGGYAYSVTNADPTTNGPNSIPAWGSGDGRHNDGGWGGMPLNYSTGSVFFGGGGGAGDSNDGNGTSGGSGGGIVYLVSYGTVSGAGQIIADGAKAQNTNLVASTFDEAAAQGDDGAGGGGGGGAVFINSTGNISLTNTLSISAQGGIGGDYFMHNAVNTHNFGPGGGGGGGYVAATNTVTGVNVNGGANGIVAGAALGSSNASKIATKFPPNGATAGGAGTITTTLTPNFYLTASASPSGTVCASSSVTLSVTVNGTTPSGLSIGWYTVAAGGTSVFTGNPYIITAPASAGTYTYYAGTCPGVYRVPIIVTVTSASGPILAISATKTITCAGLNDTLSVSGANTYTWSANAGSVTTNTAIVAPNTNTTYTVTGSTIGACAGTSTTSISITVNTAPSITITPTSNTLCSGSSDVLTATSSASSYTWSSNAGSATTSTVSVTPLSSSTYTVTGINGVCSATQTIAINVTTTPTVNIASTTTVVCNGASITFTASGATGYIWSANAGSAITNTVSVAPISNTTYTVTGNNGSCAATQTIAITTDTGPVKADSVLVSASCGLSNGDYIVNSITGGVAPYQINFNGTGFVAIPSFPDTIKNLSGNTYPVLIKDGLGCAYVTTANVGNASVISKIDSVVANANCVPANSGTITINSVIGGTAPYQASINGGAYSAIASFPYSFTNLIAGTYTVQVKDNTNCPHISIISVGTIGGITSASITPLPDTCSKQVGTITITGVSGGATPYNYALNSGTYQTANTFTALAASTDSIKIKDNNGCIYSTTVTIGGTSGPTTAAITTSQDTCNKGVGTITVVNVTGGTTPYMYALNNGTYQITNTFTSLAAGSDTIKIKDNSGCTYSLTTTITNTVIAITPTITASGSTTFCQGGSVTLSSSASSSYTWSTGATVQTITVTAGNTTYSVITKSATGCTASSDTIRVIVIPTPTLLVNNPSPICAGSSTTLTATGSLTYTWSPATGLSSTNISAVVANPTATTTYTISGNCFSSNTVMVLVNPLPIVGVTPASTVCVGNSTASATLIATGATSYSWTPATGLSATSGSMVTANPSVPMLYTVTGTDANNCHSQAASIVATSALQASFIPTPDAGNAPLNVQFTNTSNGGTNYVWIYGNGLNQNTINLTDTSGTVYNAPGTYTVTLTASNALGCTATYTTTISVLQSYSITIPNVFSPNGDNINDNFEVKATGITSLSCDIYDRWGLKLYTFNGASGYWDGTAKSGKEVDGTYFYVILTTDIKGDNHKYNGFIQLIR